MMVEAVVVLMPDIRGSYLLFPAICFVQFAFSGLFIKPGSLPRWMGPWGPSISLIRWFMQGNFINQFQYDTVVFPANNVYNFYTAFLHLFGWGGKTKWFCLDSLFYFCLTFKGATLLFLILTAFMQRGGRNVKKAIAADDA